MNAIAYLLSMAQNSFWRQVGIVAMGTIVSHTLLFLTFPIIAYLYTPSHFGAYTLYGALLSFLGVLATLRYEMAIPIAPTDMQAKSLFSLTFIWIAVFSTSVAAALWLARDVISQMFGAMALHGILGFLAIGCAFEGTLRTLRTWNLRCGNMHALAYGKMTQSFGVIVVQLLLSSLGYVGLLLSDVVGRLLAGSVHLSLAWRKNQLPIQCRKKTTLREVAMRYRRFPIFSTGATLCIQLVDNCPLIFLSAIYGSAIAGSFAMAHRVILGPLLIISMATTQVYISEASITIRDDPHRLPQLFWRTWARMALIGIVLIAFLVSIGPILVRFSFNKQWHESATYMVLLAPAVFGQFVVGPIYHTLDLLQKQKWALAVNGLGLGSVATVFLYAQSFHCSPSVAIGAYSIVVLLFEFCLFASAAFAVHRFQQMHDHTHREQPAKFAKAVSRTAA